ncbi:hypothetical protein CWO91_10250 [Bradyrhizobium genosp. SA-3]|uniref:hypothetical protein n=1 Tax=Bradyrhizobium genosp. SA-3 TaxID=508868 RepID=UPI001029FCF5|nr:hypothetical protein [Bradyrhizobium genosp. SA-3]RZN10997.1 hypothetical protein CWO91_10250 [Bradyrhizobium genosp. SA-3]
MSYATKVYKEVGGDKMTVVAGGSIQIGNVTFTVNAAGKLLVTGLPTVNPNVAGQLWANNGVLTISAG